MITPLQGYNPTYSRYVNDYHFRHQVRGNGLNLSKACGLFNVEIISPRQEWTEIMWHRDCQLEIFGGFLQSWYPTTMDFPTKNEHFGVFWGYHHFWKHPFVSPQLLPRPPKTVRPMEPLEWWMFFELASEYLIATCYFFLGNKHLEVRTEVETMQDTFGKPPQPKWGNQPNPYEKKTQDAGVSWCSTWVFGILCLNFSTSGGCSGTHHCFPFIKAFVLYPHFFRGGCTIRVGVGWRPQQKNPRDQASSVRPWQYQEVQVRHIDGGEARVSTSGGRLGKPSC